MNPYWIDASACRLAILPRPRGYDWLSDDIAAARRQVRDQGVEAGVLDLELEAEGFGDGTRAFNVETHRLVGIGHARRGEELHG